MNRGRLKTCPTKGNTARTPRHHVQRPRTILPMGSLMTSLATFFDFLLVVVGFGFIIFIHELGHFLAARWAGIRVLAFAIGFGPPVATFRKGLGLRRGSSEREYLESINPKDAAASRPISTSISPTEYRLNWLPLGGYVKMLGQDDLDPTAVSAAPDSYQNCKPWRRMVVISAGVVMNIILAAILFVIVFNTGLKTEPAAIGEVEPGSAAATAVASNAARLGIAEPGLKTGDEIIELDGEKPNSFNDLVLATAMAERGKSVLVGVRRAGVSDTLHFAITPTENPLSKLLDIGVDPPRSTAIPKIKSEAELEQAREILAKIGLAGVEPGMSLVRVGDQNSIAGAEALSIAARASNGKPFEAEFADEKRRVTVTLSPKAELQTDQARTGPGTVAFHRHLLGLTPVMKIAEATPAATEQGLQTGDVFARLGTVEFPSVTEGIPTIRESAGKELDLVVLRKDASGATAQVPLTVSVGRDGRIGFMAGDTSDENTLLALPPKQLASLSQKDSPRTPPAVGVIERPGSRVTKVNGKPVADFTQLREHLLAATSDAAKAGTEARVSLSVQLPVKSSSPGAADHPTALSTGDNDATEQLTLTIPSGDVRALHALTWTSPISTSLFSLKETTLKGHGIAESLRMGVSETHRVMMTTYLTFARLFQGTVKVEHLKGPVGIAHLGTRVAERGLVWLLFFMAMISVNLAVINFLPLPIVDGGQFLFLLFEQVRGRPVPVQIQNFATIVGLVLIGSMFLLVTFHDVMGLFGR